MRIRTIKPDFWTHPIMAKMSDPTKLLAIGLLNLADDDGYFYADPKMVRNALRPLDDDSRITTVSLRELSEIGYIELVEHPTHGQIGKVVSFRDHQVINKPKASIIKQLHDYGINTVSIPDEERLEGKGKERNGMEVTPNPKRRKRFKKPSVEELNEYGKTLTPPWKDGERFIDFYSSKGWKVGNQPMKDWQACVRTWNRNAKESAPAAGTHQRAC